ncbi:MAG: lysophospholipase [Nocardioides sp.]|nr:lysophospholipase [Nocardioides sp.]
MLLPRPVSSGRGQTGAARVLPSLGPVSRALALLLGCLLGYLLVGGCDGRAREPAAPEAGPPRVLLAGDSITGGYYASDAEHGYAALVVDSLGATAQTVTVAGARAFRVAAEVEDADLEPVDAIVLEAGANDVGKSTLTEWTAGYRRLLEAVTAASPDAAIVCLGPWNAPTASRTYEAVVRRLCAEHTYLSLSDLYATPGLRGPAGRPTFLGASDDFHPADRGHAAIAARVTGALTPG